MSIYFTVFLANSTVSLLIYIVTLLTGLPLFYQNQSSSVSHVFAFFLIFSDLVFLDIQYQYSSQTGSHISASLIFFINSFFNFILKRFFPVLIYIILSYFFTYINNPFYTYSIILIKSASPFSFSHL